MTRTSASCRRRADRRAAAGFSLLELLVVLALVSIMVALVAPRLAGTVQAIATSGERAEVTRQIQGLPLLARAAGHPIRVAAESPLVVADLELPAGWTVSTVSPLFVAANGVCRPATLRVDGGGVVEEWSVAAPDCTVDADGAR